MNDQLRSAQNVAAALAAAGHDATTIGLALLDGAVYPSLSIRDLQLVLDDRRVTSRFTAADLLSIVGKSGHYTAAEIQAVFGSSPTPGSTAAGQLPDLPLNPAYLDPPQNFE